MSYPITVTEDNLLSFTLLVEPMKLTVNKKIPLKALLKAFYIVLTLDDLSNSSSSASSRPLYNLQDKPVGVFVYHMLVFTIDNAGLGPTVYINYENWCSSMSIFQVLCRSLVTEPLLRCTLTQSIIDSNRFPRFIQ